MSHDHPENPSAPSVGAVPESPPAVSVGSGDWFGDDDIRYSDESCPKCGNGMVIRTCGRCGGEGCSEPGELYEQDPLWYDQDDVETCPECSGHGTHEWCQKCGWDHVEQRFLNGTPEVPLTPPNTKLRNDHTEKP